MQRQVKVMPYIIVAILATIFGMSWVYFVAPPIYAGVNPNRLNEAAQQQWIMNVAIASSQSNIVYGQNAAIELVNRVPNPRENIQAMLNSPNISQSDAVALQELLNKLPFDITGTPAPAAPDMFTQVMQLLIPIVIVVAIGLVLSIIVRLIARPYNDSSA